MASPSTGLEVPRESGRTVSSASTLAGEHIPVFDEKPAYSSAGEEEHRDEKGDKTDDALSSAATDTPDDTEYPTGIKFAMIVVALVLSIFLIALDMVRLDQTRTSELNHVLTILFRQLLPLLFPRLPTSSRVSTKSAGMAPPFS